MFTRGCESLPFLPAGRSREILLCSQYIQLMQYPAQNFCATLGTGLWLPSSPDHHKSFHRHTSPHSIYNSGHVLHRLVGCLIPQAHPMIYSRCVASPVLCCSERPNWHTDRRWSVVDLLFSLSRPLNLTSLYMLYIVHPLPSTSLITAN